MSDPRTYEDWISILETGTDYEADIVRDRLDDAGVTAVVLTQRDHAFNLNVGDFSPVHVMVPPDEVEDAREVLDSEPFTEEELNEAAMNADADAEPAHTGRAASMLDSSPNIAGDDGSSEEPSIHDGDASDDTGDGGSDDGGDDGSDEADPGAKRKHRDERRARAEEETREQNESSEIGNPEADDSEAHDGEGRSRADDERG
jgi:hypothetical protein